MPNVGPSPTLSPDSPQASSHTSTQQWQSFEIRMRQRRAERCLLRAEMALEAGLEDDAREALEEAERLHSDSPKLAELRAVLADRAAPPTLAYEEPAAAHVAPSAPARARALHFAAAALMFLLVGASAYLVTSSAAPDIRTAPAAVPSVVTADPGASQPATDAPAPVPAEPAPVAITPRGEEIAPPVLTATAGQTEAQPVAEPKTPATEPPPSARAATAPERSTASSERPASSRENSATPPRPSGSERSTPAPETRSTLPAFNPQFAEPRPVRLPPASQSADTAPARTAAPAAPPASPPAIPSTPATSSTSTLDRMGERLTASNVPPAERRATADKPVVADKPAAAEDTPPPAPPVAEEPRIRAVLARYEAAYSGLNASAAQQVWPAVDQRALARAFDTLQAQQVSLGRCSVQVNGPTASASCSGRITWTPKVGGGSQSAARQWRFELRNGDGAWQIARAEVR